MDYFQDAFGRFNPQADVDAAMKVSLDALLADHRLGDIAKLLSSDSNVGGVDGEPGWIIERRRRRDGPGYENWPAYADYRAFVDPRGYSLANPEYYCDEATFHSYVRAAVRAYRVRHPERSSDADLVMGKLP
jgi:hypothetical protein